MISAFGRRKTREKADDNRPVQPVLIKISGHSPQRMAAKWTVSCTLSIKQDGLVLLRMALQRRENLKLKCPQTTGWQILPEPAALPVKNSHLDGRRFQNSRLTGFHPINIGVPVA
jgi:hypothetical protein